MAFLLKEIQAAPRRLERGDGALYAYLERQSAHAFCA